MVVFLVDYIFCVQKSLEEKQVEAGKVIPLSLGVVGLSYFKEHLEKMTEK